MKIIKVITLIDLLNNIANGEKVPKSFKIGGVEHYINDSGYLQKCDGEVVQWLIYKSWLNEKVEIIEEEIKLPEKIRDDNAIWEEQARDIDYDFKDTINQLIDYLESKGD